MTDTGQEFATFLGVAADRNIDPAATEKARAIIDPHGSQVEAGAATDDERAAEFAALMGGSGNTTAEPLVEPGPRLPAPNSAQGSSARAAPRPPDPIEMLEDAMRYAVRSSDGSGRWRPLT
jgi:hypothetical protein